MAQFWDHPSALVPGPGCICWDSRSLGSHIKDETQTLLLVWNSSTPLPVRDVDLVYYPRCTPVP